jgi:hypothetical protein
MLRTFDLVTSAEQAQVNIDPDFCFPWAITLFADGTMIATDTGSDAVPLWDARNLATF